MNFSKISDFLTFLQRTANLIMISVLNDVFWGVLARFGMFCRVLWRIFVVGQHFVFDSTLKFSFCTSRVPVNPVRFWLPGLPTNVNNDSISCSFLIYFEIFG